MTAINFARKRNYGKFCLKGMCASIQVIVNNTPLSDKERVALRLVAKSIEAVLKHWDKSYKELKKEIEHERKT